MTKRTFTIRAIIAACLGLGLAIGMGALINPAGASQPSLEGWYTWETTYVGADAPTTSTITWPQTLVGKGKSAPKCGVWYQQDRYEGSYWDIKKVIKDGILTHNGKPEDHKIYRAHKFVYGGDCSKDPYVEEGDWEDGTFECDDTTVDTTRTVSTTTYTWNRATAKFTSETTTVTENSTRPLTGDEAFPCFVNEDGEDVEAVSVCTADGFATITTTTTAWVITEAGIEYDSPVVTTEVVADAGCAEDTPPPAKPVKATPKFTG